MARPLRIAFLLFVFAFLSYSSFYNAHGSGNTTSRIGLTLAIVERGELTIDPVHHLTDDKAFVDGHYVSDKAPGMSFMALPAVFLTVQLLKALDIEPEWNLKLREGEWYPRTLSKIVYAANLSTSTLFTAAAVAALFLAAWRLGASVYGALFAAFAYGFGTPTWGWATTFFGHSTSGALLVLAFAGLVYFIPSPNQTFERRKVVIAGFAVGLMLGWAVVVELIAAPATVFIGLYALWHLRNLDRHLALPIAIAALVGGCTALVPLLAYNTALFGSPFELGYSHVVGFERMQEGFFGIRLPKAEVLYEITFGEKRGIIWLAPFLLLFPFAWIALIRHAGIPLGLLVLGVGFTYFAINAGYAYWDGGASTGPRHITGALPFLCLPFAWLWSYGSYTLRIAAATLLAMSIVVCLIAASVDMTAAMRFGPNVVLDYLLPQFLRGDLPSVISHRFGLPGHFALLPLLVCWIVVGYLLLRSIRAVPAKAMERRNDEAPRGG